jgi:hypothetical protein
MGTIKNPPPPLEEGIMIKKIVSCSHMLLRSKKRRKT